MKFHTRSTVLHITQVRYFCCGMSKGFISITKKTFPDAKICIDPFHVIKRLNDIVDDVRLRYQRRFHDIDDTESFRKIKGPVSLRRKNSTRRITGEFAVSTISRSCAIPLRSIWICWNPTNPFSSFMKS